MLVFLHNQLHLLIFLLDALNIGHDAFCSIGEGNEEALEALGFLEKLDKALAEVDVKFAILRMLDKDRGFQC